jgi:hypothetical protein
LRRRLRLRRLTDRHYHAGRCGRPPRVRDMTRAGMPERSMHVRPSVAQPEVNRLVTSRVVPIVGVDDWRVARTGSVVAETWLPTVSTMCDDIAVRHHEMRLSKGAEVPPCRGGPSCRVAS